MLIIPTCSTTQPALGVPNGASLILLKQIGTS